MQCPICDFPYAWKEDRWRSPEEKDKHNGEWTYEVIACPNCKENFEE